jgi:membrane protein implicated in regulation of membrane protease activity
MSVALFIPWWAAMIGLIVASALALWVGWAIWQSFRTPDGR